MCSNVKEYVKNLLQGIANTIPWKRYVFSNRNVKDGGVTK